MLSALGRVELIIVMEETRPKNLSAAIRALYENATRLLEDAQYLMEYGRFPTSYALSILAQEEYAKTFLLFLVGDDAIPWNAEVRRALRDHTCKQLIASIMEYLDAEWQKLISQCFDPAQFRRSFPSNVADALNIVRHEKVPRMPEWSWVDDALVDKQARAIADGEVDKQKQNALYVGLGKTGQVYSSPTSITETEATLEHKKTQRLMAMFSPYGENVELFKNIEYSRVSDSFKMLFGTLSLEEYTKRW